VVGIFSGAIHLRFLFKRSNHPAMESSLLEFMWWDFLSVNFADLRPSRCYSDVKVWIAVT
jgi:hypothetical protein